MVNIARFYSALVTEIDTKVIVTVLHEAVVASIFHPFIALFIACFREAAQSVFCAGRAGRPRLMLNVAPVLENRLQIELNNVDYYGRGEKGFIE